MKGLLFLTVDDFGGVRDSVKLLLYIVFSLKMLFPYDSRVGL